jgi:hypothetical protein
MGQTQDIKESEEVKPEKSEQQALLPSPSSFRW